MNWDGLVLINKPQNETSHTVVQTLKKRFQAAKAGHLGTLDPLATGVLPICLGKATRLAPFYMGADKSYIAAIRFGFSTSTDDRDGDQQGPTRKVSFSRTELETAVGSFCGEYEQKPPAYSAKKIKGKKAYELARRGVDPQLTPRKIKIHDCRLLHFENDVAMIFIHCASGTYIRSIARELGTILGCGAHVKELTRTKFNHFTLEESCEPDAPWDKLTTCFIPVDKMLSHIPELVLDELLSKRILTGSAISTERTLQQDWIRVFDQQRKLLAFAQVESNWVKPKIVFN